MTAAKAFIMGRNMFGPVRGEWDRQWNGWWGGDPPFHAPVYVLTHHARDPQPMDGGTTYYFVTGGIEAALAQARAAAGAGDVAIQGGAPTLNQHLAARRGWRRRTGQGRRAAPRGRRPALAGASPATAAASSSVPSRRAREADGRLDARPPLAADAPAAAACAATVAALRLREGRGTSPP